MKQARCLLWIYLSLSIFACAHAVEASDRNRAPVVESLDLQVPVAPIPFRTAGATHLAYEIHLTNLARSEVELVQIKVRDATSGASLLDLREPELDKALRRSAVSQPRMLGTGAHIVVFVWMTLPPSAAPPATLVHEVDLEWVRAQGREASSFRSEPLRVSPDRVAVLGPPLRGGPWVALYDPHMAGGHRTSIYTLEGRARIPARYAIDWVRLATDGTHASGDSTLVANWYGFGEHVLAVADGVVVEAIDDMQSADTVGASQGAMPLEAASGNYIVLDIGAGRFAIYEHLQHRSVRVARGDRVRRGDIIAALGNSGSSSSGPHLHFHLADAASTLTAEGLPFVFESFEVLGRFESIDEFSTGKRWNSVTQAGGLREAELPNANVVLRFKE